MIAAVFGSSRPQPGDPLYARAQRTGYLLAEHGYTVMTGGYNGVMEAASRGAKEANGTTIGVTVSLFEKIGARSGPNAYVDEVVTYDTLSERVLHLCTHGDVIVALDGGIGTLAEIALTWNLIQSEELEPRPFVLLSERWGPLLQEVYGEGIYIKPAHMDLWQTATTPEEAVRLVTAWAS